MIEFQRNPKIYERVGKNDGHGGGHIVCTKFNCHQELVDQIWTKMRHKLVNNTN